MFGVCIWYEIIKSHIFYNLNKTLAIKCGCNLHNPHITINYNPVNKNDYNLDNYKLYDFYKVGEVYQTHNENFYSLQQDYVMKNSPKKYHVSLIYKVDTKFTDNEINYANTLDIPSIIKSNEIKKTIWNCDNVDTKLWYEINLQSHHEYLDDNEDI